MEAHSLLLGGLQEKNAQEAESKAQEAKASGEQALAKASELHAKELEELRALAEVTKTDLSSSADKNKQLEKQVEELLVYKEQAQVSFVLKDVATLWLKQLIYI